MQKVADKLCKQCSKAFHPVRRTREFCSRDCSSRYRMEHGNYVVSEETKAKMSKSHTGKKKHKQIKLDLDKIETLFGLTNEYIINKCLKSPFPGTIKWPADNPIWNCRSAKSISPKEAWKSPKYIEKAVSNLFYIISHVQENGTEENLVKRVEKACKNDDINLLREVLNRFTIAKIAPKVTAFMPSDFERIIEESNVDVSVGIYCPMAGFGGIIEGAKQYYKKHNINAEIEAYDINKNFCDYYGWIQKDVLSDYVETDKVVFVCPPFGKNTERWEGTPDEMYYEFEEWVKLIKEHIKAPNYIFVGPEIGNKRTDENPNIKCGLFGKKRGIQWYPEYSINNV